MARIQEEELQFLSFLDIFRESFKLIFSRPKIFVQITLFFILPLSCIGLAAYIELSPYRSGKLFHSNLYGTPMASPAPPNINDIMDSTSSKVDFRHLAILAFLVLSKLGFFTLSASTVVYTVVCIHNGKEITFTKAISVVPRVWKQLIVTYLCSFCILFLFSFVYFTVVGLLWVLMVLSSYNSTKSLGIPEWVIIALLVYIVGITYVSFLWQLADIVSITEKNCGMKALKNSMVLVKGKMGTTFAVFLVLFLFTLPSQVFLIKLRENNMKIEQRICYGILSLISLTLVSLLTLVVKTVLYFVCKSYHHEPIDKLCTFDYIVISHGDNFV